MVGFLKNMNLLESVHIVFKNTDISNMAKTAWKSHKKVIR